jgi:lipid-A-disaccharide synthase
VANKKSDNYFISAGEHSGDLLGADLVLALREKLPKLHPVGVAGTAMLNAGVEGIASIDDFSVMGVTEVARKLGDLRMLETRLLAWIDRTEPRFAVLIDNPVFHLRFAEQLRMRGIPVFQYVAPKIWARGEGRVPKIRESFDLVLGILPFEEEFFKERGINYAYVGSPQKDRIDKVMIKRESLGLRAGQPVIACLPGSRVTEIRRNLPIIASIRDAVARLVPDAEFIVPVAQNLAFDEVVEVLAYRGGVPRPVGQGHGLAVESVEVGGLRLVRGMSLEIMATADVAIVASGTATLECALLGTPMVVVYAMSEITYQVARRTVKVPWVSLVNLMAGRKLVEEYIQDISAAEVAAEVKSLLEPGPKRKATLDSFEDIRDRLKGAAADTAATAIAAHLGEGQKPSPFAL